MTSSCVNFEPKYLVMAKFDRQGWLKIRDQTKTVFDSLISNLLTERNSFTYDQQTGLSKTEKEISTK